MQPGLMFLQHLLGAGYRGCAKTMCSYSMLRLGVPGESQEVARARFFAIFAWGLVQGMCEHVCFHSIIWGLACQSIFNTRK